MHIRHARRRPFRASAQIPTSGAETAAVRSNQALPFAAGCVAALDPNSPNTLTNCTDLARVVPATPGHPNAAGYGLLAAQVADSLRMHPIAG